MCSIKLLPGATVGWSLVPKSEGKDAYETFGWGQQFWVVYWKYGYPRCLGMLCVTVLAPPISAGRNVALLVNPLSGKWHHLSQLVTFPGSRTVIPTPPWCPRLASDLSVALLVLSRQDGVSSAGTKPSLHTTMGPVLVTARQQLPEVLRVKMV